VGVRHRAFSPATPRFERTDPGTRASFRRIVTPCRMPAVQESREKWRGEKAGTDDHRRCSIPSAGTGDREFGSNALPARVAAAAAFEQGDGLLIAHGSPRLIDWRIFAQSKSPSPSASPLGSCSREPRQQRKFKLGPSGDTRTPVFGSFAPSGLAMDRNHRVRNRA